MDNFSSKATDKGHPSEGTDNIKWHVFHYS